MPLNLRCRDITRVLEAAGCDATKSWTFGSQRVWLEYTNMGSPRELSNALASTTSDGDEDPPSVVLAAVVGNVRLGIQRNDRCEAMSARFTAQEIVTILGNEWPNTRNLPNIRRCVFEQKCFPIKPIDPPSEKSLSAQGQTKKPGSHSESRHH